MRNLRQLRVVAAGVAGLGMTIVALDAQRGGRGITAPPGQCPPGTVETRPGRCQTPEFPAPSIIDYKPRSTLVVPEHPVPRAKYPAIDVRCSVAERCWIDNTAPPSDT